jgi:hypothetical protein
MSRVLEFTVTGVAATKGSGRAIVSKSTGRAMYLPDNPRTKDWQAAVGWTAAAAIRGGGIPFPSGPVAMAVVFFLPRPKALLTKRTAPIAVPHVKKPDLDKTVRAVRCAQRHRVDRRLASHRSHCPEAVLRRGRVSTSCDSRARRACTGGLYDETETMDAE